MRILALALSFFSLSPTPLSSVEFKLEIPGPSSYEHIDSNSSHVCSSDRLRADVLRLVHFGVVRCGLGFEDEFKGRRPGP